MRELTLTERQTLEKRRKELGNFLTELSPVLIDFADRLGLPKPDTIVTNPEGFLEAIDNFMTDQVIAEDNRIWIMARLSYLVGQILVNRLGGEWQLNENPNSRFFLRYVIGGFPGVRNRYATVDPFTVVDAYLAQPAGRSLVNIISEAEHEVQTYWDELGKS